MGNKKNEVSNLYKEINFLMYNTEIMREKIKIILKDNSIWLSQKAMSELFGCSTDNVALHLKNIYKEGELQELSTTEDFSVVQTEGSRAVAG